MSRALAILLIAISFSPVAQAQSPAARPPSPDKDRLGLTCSQILKMTSTDWIDYYGKKTDLIAANMPYDLLNANASYGKCYDARTDALAASLARTGKGPNKAAREEFAAFESDLRQFEAKALADAKPANDVQQKSYADLYEKQFRYEFYKEFQEKAINPSRPTAAAAPKSTPPAPGGKSSSGGTAAAGRNPSATPSGDANSAPHEATPEERAHSDADPVTQAKNRFGKILEALPEDQMHEIHAAFSEVIGTHAISESTRLAVYRYAIFLLQPEGATPAEQPPF
jgi:hypothetical protein